MLGKAVKGKGNRATRRNAQIGEVRQAEAVKLRLTGLSCREIGERLGISEKNAWKHLRNALAAKGEEREESRTLMVARLDAILAKLWPQIDDSPAAATAAIAIEKRRADLLGLDAPKRTETTGPDGGPIVVTWGGKPPE